jgi:hypothetical protein
MINLLVTQEMVSAIAGDLKAPLARVAVAMAIRPQTQ